MHANASKLPRIENAQSLPQPNVYPAPFTRRSNKNPAIAKFTASITVKMYENLPPGYGQIVRDGPNFTATQTPATTSKSCQAPAPAPLALASNASGTNKNTATSPNLKNESVPVPVAYRT